MKRKKSILVIFNHGTLSKDQIDYLKFENRIEKENILYLDDKNKTIWGNIDTESSVINLDKLEEFILDKTKIDDYILIQGEFGAVFKLVDFCFRIGRIPVYATSKRESQDFEKEDGSIEKRSVFKFVRFREYERDNG